MVWQLAKMSGFSPIVTTALLHNEGLLKSLGATHILDRHLPAPAILAELQKIIDGAALEYDAISLADTQSLGYDALAPGGVLVVVQPDQVPV